MKDDKSCLSTFELTRPKKMQIRSMSIVFNDSVETNYQILIRFHDSFARMLNYM